MTRQQKEATIAALKPRLADAHLYLTDFEGLTAQETHQLRSRLRTAHIHAQIVPNTLLQILFRDTQYASLAQVLKRPSMLLITQADPALPAEILRTFQKEINTSKPQLKGAYAYGQIFVGPDHLKTLTKLKSKEQLLAELIMYLQAPVQRTITTLQSSADTLGRIIKTLSDK